VSLQVAILKVLSGHPGGRASVADLKSDLAFLNSIGADWTNRLKRLAARAPVLDIFGQGHVLRDKGGWQLSEAGRELLAVMEAPDYAPQQLETKATAVPPVADQPAQVAIVVRIEEYRQWRQTSPQYMQPAQRIC
jgi:hypothetical protein